ncbi:MAG TPA: flagellar hook-associated protein 3 [Verrucomicrobia bacterium]|nr:MAG: flagellar hook-associated protein 3 [Lentisphaerae bacterium GWF2_57_35]HBA84071.1 flagellar hook-associated protein 3 [Verrucomicrobiota bacterium]
MRISDQTLNQMLSGYILKNRDAAYKIQEQIASGQKIHVASDDPNAYDSINRLHNNESYVLQYARNVSQLKSELLTIDGSLQKVSGLLGDVSNLIVRASNGTIPPSDRKTMGEEADQMLEDLVTMANSNPDGRYIYAGLRTDAPPYVVTRDANGRITDVAYQGNTEVRQVEVGKGAYVAANLPGSDTTGGGVFQSDELDLFSDLMQLRDRLLSGENPVDPETFTADAATDTLTVAGKYRTGALVQVGTDDTLPGGLDPNKKYFAIRISDTEIQLADSLANARAGVAVDITSPGAGTQTVTQLSLEESERDLEHISSMLGVIGAREQRVEVCEQILSQWESDIGASLEDLEAVDIAEATILLTSKKTAYEAALRATSTMMGTSLLNYM